MFKKTLLAGAMLLALLSASPATADQSTFCLPTSGTVSGLTIVTGANAAFKALATNSAGSSEPANDCSEAPIAGQQWLDTSDANPVLQIFDGTEWEPQGTLDISTNTWTPPIGGGATSLASAATTDLWSVPQSYVVITGTTTITQLAGSEGPVIGTLKTVSFAGALTLTHNATQLILPGGRSFTTAVGDKAVVVALGGGNVAVVSYTPASGMSVQPVPTGHVDQFLLASCPALWIEGNGGTIGDSASGASIRANADTAALFSAMWALSASASPIYTSTGSASSRGASASADFAAHKRITVPDLRGVFLRGLDDSRGVDSGRGLGTQQAAATSVSGVSASASSSASSSFSGNALPAHNHTVTSDRSSWGSQHGNPGGFRADTSEILDNSSYSMTSTSVSAGTPSGSVSTSVSTSVSLSGGAETRPINVAVKQCVKL